MNKSPHNSTNRFLTHSVAKLLLASVVVSFSVSACGQQATPQSLTLSTSPSNAKNQNEGVSLVSLGDSITFGEHLPGSKLPVVPGKQGTPSKYAYPFLVGKKEKWNVHDLGMAGYTSTQLLRYMKNKRVKHDLRTADVVTVDIGSNDLIAAAYNILEQMFKDPSNTSPQTQQAIFAKALNNYAKKLPEIITQIRKQTDAPIILMTLYDPFPAGSSLHEITEPLLAKANHIVLQTAVEHNCMLANIYSLMNHHQNELVRVKSNDIHPTIAGQEAIANVVENVINNAQNYRPEQYVYTTSDLNIYSHPHPSTSPAATVTAGHLIQVIGRKKDWLRVRTATAQVGYVQRTNLQLIDWPWPRPSHLGPILNNAADNNSGATSQQTPSTAVDSGQIHVQMSPSIKGFRFHNTIYASLSQLAKAIGANLQVGTENQTIDVQTILQSGIKGWVDTHKTPPVLHYFWPMYESPDQITGKGDYNVHYTATGTTQFVQLQQTDYLLEIDGEPVRLNAPVIQLGQGQFLNSGQNLYVPVYEFWKALGGNTKQ
ncbi:GDSL-type esterase/lipase family protein [Alicyclobacillus sp. SO9]|uniref:GDSL-type esterase/lipase family protein n=1 Tax=Alicyclobacillus sp. SO9 TaxID=2665646 RepID=UPI0018E74CBA|nr:GDSL-type esterase/lipase family protein [Alicyclobacillus sp. SO9]QQE78804.1 SH3 domain-containing protein [Alicyclobacillus sp. SO9]